MTSAAERASTPPQPAVLAPPLLRFRKNAEGRVQLRTGDLAVLSEETGVGPTFISHILSGRRDGRRGGARGKLEAAIGAPLELVDPPSRRRRVVGG